MEGAGGGSETPTLEVRLLGGFGLSFADGPITGVDAPRLQSLLAHLVLNRGVAQPRERLAFQFWPDSEEGQARTNLRQALHHLRRALPEPDRFLKSESRTVHWLPEAPMRLDVAEFERHLAAAADARDAGAGHDERGQLERAVELYVGDLLPEAYEDWVVPERDRLRDLFLGAAERLADLLESERDYRGASPWARLLLEDAPLNEEHCRRLMRLHALGGDRAGALRVYHGTVTALAREMGVEPSPATREAYERLLEPEGDAAPRKAARATDASPLVGRDAEWDVLRQAWRRAGEGESVLAIVAGEAGIGKSRLCEELRDWVEHLGFEAASSRCYSGTGGLAYAPIVDLLRTPAIAPRLRRLGESWLVELARLLPELLDEHPVLTPPSPLTDDWQRTRLLDAVSHAIHAEDRPTLLVIDDLQWCDAETLDWIHYVLRSRPGGPLLLAVTARSEELDAEHAAQPLLLAARASGQAVELDLGPLDAAETAALARNVSGRELGDEREERVHRETEGNPLFVVEWMRAGLVDDGPASTSDEPAAQTPRLPPRAQSVIEARLSQLSPGAQELASVAAAVGRAFTYDALARASSRSEEQVVEALDELRERRIVREQGVDAYDFSHDKLREAAYLRVGPARRLMLHRRVAQALERLHAGDLDAVSSELATHYERAGWGERAIDFYARAAEVAERIYANERVIDLLSRALELLEAEAPTPARDTRELAILTALGPPLVAIQGYGAARVLEVYSRAFELCERLGVPPDPPVLRGLALVNLVRGDLRRAYELGGQLLELGEDDPMVRVEGNYVLGVTSFWLGEFEAARDQLERAIAEYLPDRARPHLALYSQDPRIVCLSRLAYVLYFLGEPERAEETAREAVRLADELEHPFSLAYALNFAAWVAIDAGEESAARERAERMTALAEEQQLGYLQPMGRVLHGWILAGDGRTDEAIAEIRAGLDAYTQLGWTLNQPHTLAFLARVYLDLGHLDDARAAILQALELSERIGQRYLDARHQLLMGELLLAQGADRSEAQARFSAALEIARGQGAKPLAREASERLERVRTVAR